MIHDNEVHIEALNRRDNGLRLPIVIDMDRNNDSSQDNSRTQETVKDAHFRPTLVAIHKRIVRPPSFETTSMETKEFNRDINREMNDPEATQDQEMIPQFLSHQLRKVNHGIRPLLPTRVDQKLNPLIPNPSDYPMKKIKTATPCSNSSNLHHPILSQIPNIDLMYMLLPSKTTRR